jgi:hypothetical protein
MSLPSLRDIDVTIEGHLQQIALLEAKITFEREAITLQRQLRNAHSPVNRCPPEVLSRIFLLCRPPSWQEDSLQFFLRAVTHVCARWRMSALADPSLWNLVPCRHATGTDWMLARAKSASLIYRGLGNAMNVTDQQHEVELLQDISRVRVLALSVHPEYLLSAAQAALAMPAPVLETLELTGIRDDVYPASSLLINGQLPRLRFLRVERLEFQWQAPHLCQLRSLIVSRVKNKISVPAMLLTLRNMARLERLELNKTIQSQAEHHRTNGCLRRVVLPCLSLLYVHDNERGVLSFLDSLETPALRNLRISTTLRDGTSANRILFTHLVSSHLNTSSVSFKSCDILQRGGSLVFLASSSILMDPRRCYSQVDLEGASFEFRFCTLHANFVADAEGNTEGESAWPGAAVSKSILAVVRNMSRLSSLIVRAEYNAPLVRQIMYEKHWPALLQTLPPSVTAIQVVDAPMSNLHRSSSFTFVALSSLGGIHVQLGSSSASLPASGLRQLTLAGAGASLGLVVPKDQLEDARNIMKLLRMFLKARAAHEGRLEQLELVNCQEGEDEQLADLEARGLVGEMIRRQGRFY